MIKLLAKIFIKDRDNAQDPKVRNAYGVLASIVGIILNILLFIGKFIAGILSGSIAITADAFNNLSDAGSSFITLIGFKFAGMKPDIDHPFGH
jgi:divalent metal cation (Fe/Co/Zn/Cd) transporter